MNSEQDIIEELELCGCKNAIEVFKEFENSLEYYEDNEIYNKHGNLIKKYNYKKKKFRKSFFFSLTSLLYRGVINEETDEAFSWLNDTIFYNIMLEGNYDHFKPKELISIANLYSKLHGQALYDGHEVELNTCYLCDLTKYAYLRYQEEHHKGGEIKFPLPFIRNKFNLNIDLTHNGDQKSAIEFVGHFMSHYILEYYAKYEYKLPTPEVVKQEILFFSKKDKLENSEIKNFLEDFDEFYDLGDAYYDNEHFSLVKKIYQLLLN